MHPAVSHKSRDAPAENKTRDLDFSPVITSTERDSAHLKQAWIDQISSAHLLTYSLVADSDSLPSDSVCC